MDELVALPNDNAANTSYTGRRDPVAREDISVGTHTINKPLKAKAEAYL